MAKKFGELIYTNVDNFFIVSPLRRKFERFKILKEQKLRGPAFQNWELEILQKLTPNRLCAEELNSHPKNCGWIRKREVVGKKRKAMNHPNYQ